MGSEFMADRPPMARGKSLACLARKVAHDGRVMTVAAWVAELVKAGGRPGDETERRTRKVTCERIETVASHPVVRMPDGTYYKVGSATARDYAAHLLAGGTPVEG